MSIEKTFSRNLKAIRTLQGITQTELAEKLQVKPQSISKYESGENFPTGKRLAKLIEILNIEPEHLLGEKEIQMISEIQLLEKIKEKSNFVFELKFLEDHLGRGTEEHQNELRRLLYEKIDISSRTNQELIEMYSALLDSKIKKHQQKFINEWIDYKESEVEMNPIIIKEDPFSSAIIIEKKDK